MSVETRRVPSPCVRNCCLDDNDICLGCFRSIEEICQWAQADDIQRRQILENTRLRRARKFPESGQDIDSTSM